MPKFVNPTGYWSHEGEFSVHLVGTVYHSGQELAAEFDGLPGFSVKYHVVTAGADPAHPGFVKQSMGAIQCRCGEREFFFGYKYILAITKADGSPLWVNDDHRQAYPLPET